MGLLKNLTANELDPNIGTVVNIENAGCLVVKKLFVEEGQCLTK